MYLEQQQQHQDNPDNQIETRLINTVNKTYLITQVSPRKCLMQKDYHLKVARQVCTKTCLKAPLEIQNIFHDISRQYFWLVSPGENPGPISLKIEVNKKGNLTVKERILHTFLLIILEERSSLSFSFTSSSHLFKSCKISCNSSAFCRTFSCTSRASAIFLSLCFKTFQCTIHIAKINYV